MSTDATAAMAPPDDPQQEPQLVHTPSPASAAAQCETANQNQDHQDHQDHQDQASAPATVDPNDISIKDPPERNNHPPQKPIGLHSPPDSNNAMKLDDSDDESELSDLDDAAIGDIGIDLPPTATATAPAVEPPADDVDEDIGEVFPDHWSGTVPVFKPEMHQFKDFKKFVRCSGHGQKRKAPTAALFPCAFLPCAVLLFDVTSRY